jgi:hypothetical protein
VQGVWASGFVQGTDEAVSFGFVSVGEGREEGGKRERERDGRNGLGMLG